MRNISRAQLVAFDITDVNKTLSVLSSLCLQRCKWKIVLCSTIQYRVKNALPKLCFHTELFYQFWVDGSFQWDGSLLSLTGRNWNKSETIGHFQITSGLFLKASLGAHPFICKSIFIHTQIKLIFMWMKIDLHMKGWAPRLALKKRPEVIWKWPVESTCVSALLTSLRWASLKYFGRVFAFLH